MISLIYVSSARKLFSQSELADLLRSCRDKNQRHEITGMLLYKGGNFIQLLEGPATQVREIYASIERDPRHFDVSLMLEEPIVERQFPNWSMGFCDLDGDARDIPGYTDFLRDRNGPAAHSAAVRLLALFRENM